MLISTFLKSKYCNVVILMRANCVNTESGSSNYLGRVTGSILVDLGGYTLTRGGGQSLIEAGTKNMTESESLVPARLTVTNGRILAMNKAGTNSGHILTYQTYVNYDKTIDITFKEVTFAASADLTDDGLYSLVCRSWSASGGATGKITSALTFEDCVFDFSGSEGTKAVGTRIVSTSGGKATQDIRVVLKGGRYIGTTAGVTLLDIDSSDSVSYLQGSEGEYLLFDLTFGNPPTGAIETDEGMSPVWKPRFSQRLR